jgi:hypothetical protein
MVHKIRDNESICTGCDKRINDDVETKWNRDAEPFCRKCWKKVPMSERKSRAHAMSMWSDYNVNE